MRVERVVVGAGLMGHGIAQVFAEAGAPVTVWDPNPEVRASVPDRVRANLRALGRAQRAADQVIRRIAVHETIEPAVDGAGVVIEAAPEDLRRSTWWSSPASDAGSARWGRSRTRTWSAST